MKKLYTCNTAGTYFYNGANRVVAYGDSVVLDSREALKYASSFTLATDWNLIFNEQTITNAGGTITRSKTFYKENLQEWDGRGNLEDVEAEGTTKVVGVTATVVGTMPAGAVTTLDIYDENGSVIENKYEVGGALTNTSGSISFLSSYLNEGYDYKITVAVPQGNPDAYVLTVEVKEIFPAEIKNVLIETDGLLSGTNLVTITAKDENGDAVDAGIFDCYIASSPAGLPAPATTINGITGGSNGGIVEFADDQFVKVFVGTNGKVDIDITPTDAGTPTATAYVFAVGGASTGDTVTFGTEVYEFTTDGTTALTVPTNIRIDMTGAGGSFTAVTDETTTAQAFKYVFNLETAYNVVASGADATITMTATNAEDYVAYNALATTASITAPSTCTPADATFGGGAGVSTTGVAVAVWYWLAVKYGEGKVAMSHRLPFMA